MSKINNSINTISILSSLLMLALCYWARMDLPAYVSGLNYITLFALSATIFCLPDFLCHYFPSKNSWLRSSELYTIFLIIFLGTVGILLPEYSAWLGYGIVLIGILLALWEIYHFIRNKSFFTLTSGLASMGFIVLLFYSRSFVSPLFPEQIILGNAHIDTLFPSSMSNMFSTLGWTSTGLDGSPYVPYHWGSQVLFGGLKNWLDLNSLMFFNIAYPVIFIPLFFKSLFYFLNRLFIYKGITSADLLFAISFVTVLYSLKFAGFSYATPLKFESLTISLVFTFLYGATLLHYVSKPNININIFFFYSIFVLLLISSSKISTGGICVTGMAYLYLRKFRSLNNLLVFFIGAVIIVTFYLFVFPFDRLTYSATFGLRISNLWFNSVGFITYLSGAFLAVIYLLKTQSFKNRNEIWSVIRSGKYIDLEILFVITISSMFGAILVSSLQADVYMFCTPQFFITIPFIIMFSQRYFDRFAASIKAKTFFLFLLIILSIVSNPDVFRTYYHRTIQVRHGMSRLSQQQQVLQSFLFELFKIEKEVDKKQICIYIPSTEKWYYESQSIEPLGQQSLEPSNPLGSAMVIPAITGIALIGGISDSIYKANYNYAGYYYYKQGGQVQVKNLIEAKESAIRKGYTKLIKYQYIDGILAKQTFDLKK